MGWFNLYNYAINETIGNPIYPNDDYFVIKFIGSTFDVYVEYFNGNQFNNSNSIHLFNNQLYKKSINYDYRFNSKRYKIDYIIGTSENCKVEIKKNISDTNELETIDTLSTKNDRIFLNI